jgi:hypothetical protein
MTDAVIIAIIGGLFGIIGGTIGSVLVYKTQKPVAESNVNKLNTEANIALIKPLTDRIDRAESELLELREELRNRDMTIEAQNEVIREQNIGVGLLITQLVNARMVPSWKPKESTVATLKPHNTGFGMRRK